MVDAVIWPKAGAVNKMDKRNYVIGEEISHLLIFAALKLSIDKFCT